MVDLWPRQPAEIWKMSLINLLQWKYFEIWGRQNWTALSSCTTLYVIFKLSNLQIPQLQNRDNNIQVYSRLIVCVPPQFHMLKPNPQCDDIRRWGFGEVTKSWGWYPHEWVKCIFFIKETPESSLALSATWRHSENMAIISYADLCELEANPPQILKLLAPWSWTCSLQNNEKSFLLFMSHPIYGILL